MMMKLQKQFIRRAERVNNPSQEPRDTSETHSDCIKPNQFSSTLEARNDIGYLTPPSRCVSGVASSASQNLRGVEKWTKIHSAGCALSPSSYSILESQAGIHQNNGDHNGIPGYQRWNMWSVGSDNLIIWIYSIAICLAKYGTFLPPKTEVTCALSSRIYSKKLLTSSALVPKESGKMNGARHSPYLALVRNFGDCT
ncbi:hypothetical protein OIU84_004633 [Salix udensis]|uniref:Uncharacterized protein n=1 Tax=Salix udensis TaxID=889485 RepID=A0AAD6K2T5_9ROSI|nr:hypothetical protein OIU84_004633 [Salix udensis]